MKRLLILATLFVGLASLQACYYDSEEKLYGVIVIESALWQADIEPIISTNCAIPGCHAAGSGLPDLSTYANVKAFVDDGSIAERVVQLQDMPPSDPLTPKEVALVEFWINEGALEN